MLRRSRRLPFSVALVLLVVLVTGVTGVVLGGLAWREKRAGARAFTDLAMDQAANLTADHVLRLFGDVEPAVRQAPLLVAQGLLDPKDDSALERYVITVLRAHPELAWASYSDEDDRFIGARRERSGAVVVNRSFPRGAGIRLEEERRRKEVLHLIDEGMSVVNRAGQVTLWSDTLVRLAGCPRDRALGRSIADAVPALATTALPRSVHEVSTKRAGCTVQVELPTPKSARVLEVRIGPPQVVDGLRMGQPVHADLDRSEHVGCAHGVTGRASGGEGGGGAPGGGKGLTRMSSMPSRSARKIASSALGASSSNSSHEPVKRLRPVVTYRIS